MKEYPTYANTGADYTKSDQYTQKCYGKPVDLVKHDSILDQINVLQKFLKSKDAPLIVKFYVENPKIGYQQIMLGIKEPLILVIGRILC